MFATQPYHFPTERKLEYQNQKIYGFSIFPDPSSDLVEIWSTARMLKQTELFNKAGTSWLSWKRYMVDQGILQDRGKSRVINGVKGRWFAIVEPDKK
jgi:hypothetical protein